MLNQCAIFVHVSPQTIADMVPMGSSVPQLLEDPKGEPAHDSPVSNPASANTTTNPESVSHNTDLQVCLSITLSLSFLLFLLNLSISYSHSCMSDIYKIIYFNIKTLKSLLPVAAFLLMCVVLTTDMLLVCF